MSVPVLPKPPATNTVPFGSGVAVCSARGMIRGLAGSELLTLGGVHVDDSCGFVPEEPEESPPEQPIRPAFIRSISTTKNRSHALVRFDWQGLWDICSLAIVMSVAMSVSGVCFRGEYWLKNAEK